MYRETINQSPTDKDCPECDLGPGTYDVEHGMDYVRKSRDSSPVNLARDRTDRHTPEKQDSISPDQYEPNKEATLYQSPRWTIGVRRPEDAQFPGDGDTNTGSAQ